jgi:antitoxin MazE
MITKVQKWGNSLGVRIPKSFASEVQFEDGSAVDISLINGNVVLKPVERKRYKLEDLVSGITSRNMHLELDTGRAVGREVW